MRARTTRPGLVLRPATPGDSEDVYAWNNEPTTRRASLDPRPIARETHDAWMAARLADPRCRMWIAEVIGQPIGVVRVERAEPGAPGRVSIALAPEARGLGLGRASLIEAQYQDGGPLVAEILSDNRASRSCFTSCGFELVASRDAADGRQILTFAWRSSDARIA